MQHNLSERMIRNKLAKYLSGTMSLRAFNQWFVPATWEVDIGSSSRLRELVGAIKLRLAEFSNGHWTKASLNRQLSLILGYNPAKPNQKKTAPAKRRRTPTGAN